MKMFMYVFCLVAVYALIAVVSYGIADKLYVPSTATATENAEPTTRGGSSTRYGYGFGTDSKGKTGMGYGIGGFNF